MGGVVDLNAADSERSLAESTPSAIFKKGLSSVDGGGSEGGVGTVVVACISDCHMSNAAFIRLVVVDWDGALVGEDVPIDDEVDTVGVQDRFNRLAHELTLEHGRIAGGVHGHVEHDDHPRSGLTVQVAGKVRLQPRLLERAGGEARVTRESDDEGGTNDLQNDGKTAYHASIKVE